MRLQFGQNLQLALKAKKMTQQNLANKLNTTQATINRWIKGINEPDLITLIRICEILDETPNSLLNFDEIEINNTTYEFSYQHANTKLTHKERK